MNDKIIVKKPPKSPGLAGVLSALFPGLGSIYNREYTKGLVYIVIFAGLVTLQEHAGGQPFFGLLLAGFWFFQLIESVQTAKRINQAALQLEEEPDGGGFKIETGSGSIVWGLILIALGAIFLLANYQVISYAHIADFWPAVIVLFGVKLLTDSLKKKK
ncbi:MAG: hypothetical protein JW747_00250 [Candidatus Aminicenantes bacterium]|nr:hypothetical protein [Candidatus Aminicenantes bacterium]